MFTLFRVMSGSPSDEESDAIDALMVTMPQVKFMFVFFMVSSSWTLLSILTAVVSEHMLSTTSQQEKEHRLANADQDRAIRKASLLLFFGIVDVDDSGRVDTQELAAFVYDDEFCNQASQLLRIPRRDIKEFAHTIHVFSGDRIELSYVAD